MTEPSLHVSLITLGVTDLPRASAFYEALGAKRSKVSMPELSVYAVGAVTLALFDRKSLAEDAQLPDERGTFSGVALAWNLPSQAEVDAAMARATGAGARMLKAPGKVFWGGYSGYFADPDGHAWEIAHNPFWPLGAEGRLEV